MTQEEIAAAAKIADEEAARKVAENIDYKAKYEESEAKNKKAGELIESERAQKLKLKDRLKEYGEDVQDENKGLSADDVSRIVANAINPLVDELKKSKNEVEELARTMISKDSKGRGEGAGAPPNITPPELLTNEVEQARMMLRNLGENPPDVQVKALAEILKTGVQPSFDDEARIAKLK